MVHLLLQSVTLYSMAPRSGISFAALLVLLCMPLPAALGQSAPAPELPLPQPSALEPLDLTPALQSQLQHAMQAHDYVAAEKLLLPQIQPHPHSPRDTRLLDAAGVVYFLDRDYMSAAIAWKKSEAIAPLNPQLEFSLAMAYIRMARPEWARPVLTSLAAQNSSNALYPYWLGRIDYDAREYSNAVREFQRAIALDPAMARAYDNLGLCYYHQNQNVLAVQNFNKAIDLNRNNPSAWPYLNLAVTLELLNRAPEAEADLRQAIRIDPNLAQAHFQLGIVLDGMKQSQAAIDELQTAARLDAAYAEPHIALARIYHRLGQETTARAEQQTYLRLHGHVGP